MAIADDNAFELPKLRSSFILENDTEFLENDNVAEFFDVKFCPYQPLDAAPVFAAISKKHVVICTLSQTSDSNPCEVLSVIRDDDVGIAQCTIPALPTSLTLHRKGLLLAVVPGQRIRKQERHTFALVELMLKSRSMML
jgi:hypothetical protein